MLERSRMARPVGEWYKRRVSRQKIHSNLGYDTSDTGENWEAISTGDTTFDESVYEYVHSV